MIRVSTQARAKGVGDAMAAWVAKQGTAKLNVMTRAGEVRIRSLDVKTSPDGVAYVDVVLDGPTSAGDPHFRIVNPPLLVEDQAGAVRRGARRFRLDPLAALAEIVAQHGGATVQGEGR